MIKTIKSRIPWWLKVLIKLLLCKVPYKERIFRKFLFRWGDMEIPSKACDVCVKHYAIAQKYLCLNEKTVLELGPGDSLNSAIFFYFIGAKKIYLVDNGDYASSSMHIYKHFIDYLMDNAKKYMVKDLSKLKECRNVIELLNETNSIYLTQGLDSFSLIKDSSVDFIFSNNVLEHIYKNEFIREIKELYRISREGVSSHIIDYKDHLSDSINSLKFSSKVWESNLFKTSGFYTNRLRHNTVMNIIKNTGFNILETKTKNYNKKIDKVSVNKEFIGRKDLGIAEAHIVMSKTKIFNE